MTIPAPEMTESELITWLKRQTLKTGKHYTLDDLAVLRTLIDRLSRAHPIGDTLADGLETEPVVRIPAADLAQLRTNVRHWREECGKLNARSGAASEYKARAEAAEARLAASKREREDALDKLADAAEWRERVADDYGKALDALAASEANVLALRGLLMEARNEIDHYADTAREHDLVARIDAALAAPPEGL